MVIKEGTNVIIGNATESINAVISSIIIDEQNDFVDLELTLENGDNKLYAFESFGKKLFLTKNDMKNEINYTLTFAFVVIKFLLENKRKRWKKWNITEFPQKIIFTNPPMNPAMNIS